MNKSDLKDGMMLKLRNDNMYSLLHGYLLELTLNDTYKIIASMDDYDDEFNNLVTILSKPFVKDIMKIYDKDMNVLWERKDVDWSKVEVGTKVMVKFNFDEEYQEGTFICINDNGKFLTYDKRAGILHWKYCKLAEEQKEEVTIDDINEDIVRYCHKNSDYCNRLCGLCTTKYILNNYNITRK